MSLRSAWSLTAIVTASALALACELGTGTADGGASADGANAAQDSGGVDADLPRATQICNQTQIDEQDSYCWIMLRACELDGPTTYYWVDCVLDEDPQRCECLLGDTSAEAEAEVVGSFTPDQDLCHMGADRVDVINAQCGWSLLPE